MMERGDCPPEPINVKLQKLQKNRHGPIPLMHKPYGYQTDLCEEALKENVVICLGTGLGKTFITVLYLKSPTVESQIASKLKVVFLAPTQDLIKQQADCISRQLIYRAKIFCGRTAHCGCHIDHWQKEVWASELEQVDIMFMTPQILASALNTNLLSWDLFSTIIFDEVHHACNTKSRQSGHPYAQILRNYRCYFSFRPNSRKPRMIGLTASLINNMPTTKDCIKVSIMELERTLDARCVTDFEVQDIRPNMVVHRYDKYFCLGEEKDIIFSELTDLKDLMEEAMAIKKAEKLLRGKVYKVNKEQEQVLKFHMQLKLAAAGFSIKPSKFHKVVDGLRTIHSRCGLWSLVDFCHALISALKRTETSSIVMADMKIIYSKFIDILQTLNHSVLKFISANFDRESAMLALTGPKPKALLDVLKYEYNRVNNPAESTLKEHFSCIVFVRSRLEVTVLNRWIQKVSKLPEYSFIKCDYAIGLAAANRSKYSCITKRSPTEQYRMLENFRKGLLNVIVTTSVLEEGIDLPTCSTVIRYDLPQNFRQYVQSRGRARQRVSSFVLITDSECIAQTKINMSKFNDFEITLKEELKHNDIRTYRINSRPRKADTFDDFNTEEIFFAKDNCIQIQGSTARTILNMYVTRFSKSNVFSGGLRYARNQIAEKKFQTMLYLPVGCPISDEIVGNIKSSYYLADNSAVVLAVKALYYAGELDENGIPHRNFTANVGDELKSLGLLSIEKLPSHLEGHVVNEGKTSVNYYRTQSSQVTNNLMKNYEKRKYKLIGIRYVSSDDSREETRVFFKNPAFGLIVDVATSNEFIPRVIYSHYGKFTVEYCELDSNMIIKRREHTNYAKYTIRLLTKCLFIGPLNLDDFMKHCLFYIVPLNVDKKLKLDKIDTAFFGSRKSLSVGDVVKINRYYTDQTRNDDRRHRYDLDENKLMIVQSVCSDMNPNSVIPNSKKGETFYQAAVHRYRNNKIVTCFEQHVIKVMPISRDIADETERSYQKDYSTGSLFYLEQFLDFFDDDPCGVMQAYNLPVLLYKLYMHQTVANFDNKFLRETKDRRNSNLLAKQAESSVMKENSSSRNDLIVDLQNDLASVEEAEICDMSCFDHESSDCEDEDSSVSSSTESDSSDEDSDSETKYKNMLLQTLDLNKQDDEERMQRWDLSKYQTQDLKFMHFEDRSSPINHVNWRQEYENHFHDLSDRIKPLKDEILVLLKQFMFKVTVGSLQFSEEDYLTGRIAKVDKELEPPVLFDRNEKPLREGTRELSLLEAFTLRRTQESYNFEALENLGDCFLKYIASVILVKNLPNANEGTLTSARSRLVSNDHFNYLAKKNSLGEYAISSSFSKDNLAYFLGKSPRRDDLRCSVYNRMRPKDLADLFESVVGSYLVYHSQYEAILAAEWLGLTIFKEGTFDEFNEDAVVFSQFPSAFANDSQELKATYKLRVEKFQKIICYEFNDPSYLLQAFTHVSSIYKQTESYERLEYLGDAILDYLVTMTLVKCGCQYHPGSFTCSRSAVVNNSALAKLAMKYCFDLFIQHSDHELYDELSRVRWAMDEDKEMSFIDMTDFDRIAKLLADVYESVAGAIYLDSGCSLDTVWSVYYPMLKEDIDRELARPTRNALARLFETFPGKNRINFETYTIETEDGQRTEVRCNIEDYKYFDGQGITKHQAKLRAVNKALENLPPDQELMNMNKAFIEKSAADKRMRPDRKQKKHKSNVTILNL